MIQPLFEHRQTFAGYDTRVLELEGDGVPIVLFHGYVDSADTWRKMLDLIARQGRRAIAVDLPGFGTADPLLSDPILFWMPCLTSSLSCSRGSGTVRRSRRRNGS